MEWSDSSDSNTSMKSGGKMDARERHKLAERQRRKSMRELFLSLHALLPHANTVRKEQSAILDEIIKYIPLAASRLDSVEKQRRSITTDISSTSSSSTTHPFIKVVSESDRNSTDCDIRVSPEPTSSVAIRVRGDRVNVSLTDTKGSSTSLLSMSAVLDQVENHGLEIVQSTHCRDGNKVLHHSESKICHGLESSPTLLKERLQELACRLHKLRKPSSLKRSFDQLN